MPLLGYLEDSEEERLVLLNQLVDLPVLPTR
jgi:hypothetical protein